MPTGNVAGQPTEFTVDIRDSGGPAPLTVECRDNEGEPVALKVRDNGDGTYTCSYTPKVPKKHTVLVSYGGVNIPRSPFRVGFIVDKLKFEEIFFSHHIFTSFRLI